MIEFLTTLSVDEVIGLCGGAESLRIIKFVMTLIDVVCFIMPMLLIVITIVSFTKNVIAGNIEDMQKETSLVLKRIVMCVGLFLVPAFVRVTVGLVGKDGVNYEECIEIAQNEDLSKYEVEYATSKSPVIDNSSTNNQSNNSTTTPPSNHSSSSHNSSSSSSSKSSSSSGTIKKADNNIFVGDSRFVGMQSAVESTIKDNWICEVGEGYNWLKSSAEPRLKTTIKDGTTYNIFINLGVNDFGNIDKYITEFQSLTKEYSNHNVIIISVNPIDDSKAKKSGYTATDKQVDDFNNKLKSASGIKYCDTNSKFKKGKWSTSGDGIHYTDETYKNIYATIKQCAK